MEEVLTAPDSPLALPNHARVLRLAVRVFNSSKRPRVPCACMPPHVVIPFPPINQVLRAEDNSTYGDCILPSFQELFRAAAASLGAPSFFRLSSHRPLPLIIISAADTRTPQLFYSRRRRGKQRERRWLAGDAHRGAV